MGEGIVVDKVYLQDIYTSKNAYNRTTQTVFHLSDRFIISFTMSDIEASDIRPEDMMQVYMAYFNYAARGKYKMYSNKSYIQKYRKEAR